MVDFYALLNPSTNRLIQFAFQEEELAKACPNSLY